MAALVVTEDFPAPPLPRWIQRLTASTRTAVWVVDTHCIVPMKCVGQAYDRAFQFRKKAKEAFAERICEPWTDVDPHGVSYAV